MSLKTVAAAGFAVVLLALSGCNPNRTQANAHLKSLKNASARLTACGEYKTPGGKPVRVFKAENDLGENLLLVVGDKGVPVSMSNAATLVIGDKTTEQMYLADSRGYIASVGFSGAAIQVDQRMMDRMKRPEPASDGQPVALMQVVKANLNGEVIQLPELDAL
jgi:hypothetical protein